MKKRYCLIGVCLLAGLLNLGCGKEQQSENPAIEPTLIANLATLKITTTDVVKIEDSKVAAKISALYKVIGDAIIGVDVTKVNIQQKPDGRVIVFAPEPHLISSRIDETRTECVKVKKNFLSSDKDLPKFAQEARQTSEAYIKQIAEDAELKKLAKDQFEMIMHALCEVAYSTQQIEFNWGQDRPAELSK